MYLVDFVVGRMTAIRSPFACSSVQFCSVQSLGWLGRRKHMRDDSERIFLQIFFYAGGFCGLFWNGQHQRSSPPPPPCPALSRPVLPCPALFRPVLPCPALPCSAMRRHTFFFIKCEGWLWLFAECVREHTLSNMSSLPFGQTTEKLASGSSCKNSSKNRTIMLLVFGHF